MSIKLILLKSNDTIISETKELVSNKEQKSPTAYLLDNPQIVKTREKTFLTEEEKSGGDFGIDVTLTPWILLASDTSMVIPTDWVVTIVEPLSSVKQMYIDKSKTFKIEEKEDGN
tara:strand:- start:183 stop:527 length:345 start_codon:yes stop_codon:yes gene_type:complete